MVELSEAGPQELRRNPLAHLEVALRRATVAGPRAVALHEVSFTTMAGVRVDPASAAGARIGAALGAIPLS